MEIRVHYKKDDIHPILEEKGFLIQDDCPYTGGFSDNPQNNLVIMHLFSITALMHEMPAMVDGIPIYKIILHQMLSVPGNTHIKQGADSFGKGEKRCRYEVSRESRDSMSPREDRPGFFDIWIYGGNDSKNIKDCHDLIRRGQSADSWDDPRTKKVREISTK